MNDNLFNIAMSGVAFLFVILLFIVAILTYRHNMLDLRLKHDVHIRMVESGMHPEATDYTPP